MLTEQDKSILQVIADNQLLLVAVKKVIKSQFSETKKDIDLNLSNELLGERQRARLSGLQKVEAGFREIEAFRSNQQSQEKNPAR